MLGSCLTRTQINTFIDTLLLKSSVHHKQDVVWKEKNKKNIHFWSPKKTTNMSISNGKRKYLSAPLNRKLRGFWLSLTTKI